MEFAETFTRVVVQCSIFLQSAWMTHAADSFIKKGATKTTS